MNLRKLTLLALILSALTLSSCGAFRRLGKDVVIGLGTVVPVIPIGAGAMDGMQSARSASDGYGGGAFTEVIILPFTFGYHALKHTLYGFAHILDIPFFLIYGPADIKPNGPDIEPLKFYDMPFFDEGKGSPKHDSGTDADSGELEGELEHADSASSESPK